MSLYQASRSFAAVALIAASALLGACGGGGGSGSASSTAASNQLKLSTAVQSEPVARYAAAFGILSGPGVGAIYSSVVQSLVTGVTSSAATTTKLCPGSGSIDIATQNAGASGLQSGETATVTFNQCVGQVQAPAVSSSASVSGSVTVQVQSAQGVVGNNSADWSYTAVETANNLTLTSPDGVTSVNGTVTFSMSYDAATGATTTTASAPTVTLAITHTASSGNVSGTITITALAYSRLHGVDPSSDTLSSSGAISVQASDAVISFGVTTPTAVTISNGNLEGGVIQLTDDGAVETITASGASSVNVVVTVGTQTGTYSENVDSLEQLTGS
ncbi:MULTISPECIES: hypothetical protein [Paraburkholderia]|jgi:hypothetical protein|uniref:Ig-like domain (Group 3) n=1 Tax=Paraburkholderia phenazinium TaxID=60549 RepID=A0A1N6K1I6_9BURK|nr:hypothetical protein [Paraburkholderia phenazinium]SIO50444.1 hypothetical protein SAMN05444168_5760 [Paraburkholderia phenazinium]